MFFQLINSEIDFQAKVIIFFTFIVAVVIALTFHEFAHSFSAFKCGDLTPKVNGRLTLNPFAHIEPIGFFSFIILGFGWAKPVPINTLNFKNYKRNTFWVSVSGVLTNLIIAFIFMPFLGLFIKFGFNISNMVIYQILFYFLIFVIQTNMLLLVFNLLPIYPLDGFNAVSSYLRYENKFVLFMRKYGFLFLIGLLIVFDIIYAATGISILNYLCYYISYPFTAFWSWVMGFPLNLIGIFALGV